MATKYPYEPNWELSLKENMQVRLTLALAAHLPGWQGATDEQIASVTNDLMELVDHAINEERRELKTLAYAAAEEAERTAADPTIVKDPGVAEVVKSVAETTKKIVAAIDAKDVKDD